MKYSEMKQEELEDSAIHVMSISYYLVDSKGREVLNDDGTVKTFRSEGEDLSFADYLSYECLIEEQEQPQEKKMKVKKITSGFVVQEYDTELREWVSQEFVASDSFSEWEDENGEYIDMVNTSYLPFVMVQPQDDND